MMKVVIERPGEIKLQHSEIPTDLKPEEVLIRVKYAGICGSDLHIFKGENPFATYPIVFGHEFTGEIAALGENVTNLALGDHVVGEPIEYCGECYACRNGHPNVCENLQVYGVHVDGGCQEYIKMSAKRTHVINKDVPWECAVLVEPLTIGFQAVWRGDVRPGDVVLVMGSGTIGLCALMAAKKKGATVITTDLFDEKLEYARKMGADYTINSRTMDTAAEVSRITNGMGANVVIDCVGSKSSLPEAIGIASAAGRVVELGLSNIVSEIQHVALGKREISLMGSRLQSNKFPESVAYVEENWKKLQGFANRIFPVEKVSEAFQYAFDNAKDVRKLLIEL